MHALTICLLAASAPLAAAAVLAVCLARRATALELARRDAEAARSENAAGAARFAAEKAEMEKRFNGELERMQRQFDSGISAMKTEFSDISQRQLREREKEMREANAFSLRPMMDALKSAMDDFGAAFRENRDQQIASRTSFDRAMQSLEKSALRIGDEADALSKALRGDSKVQGDWGEAVLANVLKDAGLAEGRDFLVQKRERGENGETLIPDVEIPMPDGGTLVVDAKTSLTAYCDYAAAADDSARAEAAKKHVKSVRDHVAELADKDYGRAVKNAQGYVLMFIPNDGAYQLAMQSDAKLAVDAFRRRVIVVNPATLMLCLQIVQLLCSRAKQNENCERIFEIAGKMHDKFATFAATFAKLGSGLDSVKRCYEEAAGQLCTGAGNFAKQLDSLRDCGVVVSKTLPERFADRG